METPRARPKWAWFCPRCGIKNLPTTADCTACRSAYLGAPPSSAAATSCPSCQERNAGSAEFCYACGKQLPGLGQRKTLMPANDGKEVEGLIFSRDVALWDAERRKTGRWPK